MTPEGEKKILSVKETLEKQLQLLSERSEYVAKGGVDEFPDETLCDLSREMVKIAEVLLAHVMNEFLHMRSSQI